MPFSNKKISIEPLSDSNSDQVNPAFLKFYKIVEQAPIAMAIIGMDGTIEFINRKAIAVFGYLPEDIPTMERWWVQVYPDETYRSEVVADWTARVTKALATGSEIEGNDYQTICKDKTIKTMFINGAPVLDKIFVMFDDITQRKKSEHSQKQVASLLRATLESTADGILVVDPAGKVVTSNRKFAELWRIPRPILDTGDDNQLLSFILNQLNSPELFLARVEELYDHPLEESFDTIEFKDGRVFERYSQPQWIGERIAGRVWSFRDVTNRRKTESLLAKTQKLESLGVLAGGIAHDFNNLLTGIFGCIDLSRTVTTNAQVREYLDIMFATMNRAKALTHQLLTFAKGGTPIQKVTPLNPFIPETAQFALSGSNVTCKVDMPENLWQCSIDRNQISQVIDNIVINAQQAMPSGGTIELSARNRSFDNTEHPPLAKGNYVMISIRDFGIGIPASILPRIFDPFYTTKAKGHGLGLATCYHYNDI